MLDTVDTQFMIYFDDLFHAYGDSAGEFSIPDSFPVFNMVFDLQVTDGVSSNLGTAGVGWFIDAIMDNDSTNLSNDLFPIVWNYFCRGDSNSAYAGVWYLQGSLGLQSRIRLRLYDPADAQSAGLCPSGSQFLFCKGYSWVDGNSGAMYLSARSNTSAYSLAYAAFSHELQHICYWASNGYSGPTFGPTGYEDVNESLSTLSEYRVGWFLPPVYDWSYDSSIFRVETCEPYSKYQIEKIWMAYLFETFAGGAGDEDDLMYRWIRTPLNSAADLTLSGLASLIWTSEFDWLGGTTKEERVSNLLQNFLVAKFANAPDFAANSRFGSSAFHSMADFHFFEDRCTYYDSLAVPMSPVDCPTPYDGYPSGHSGCWNVRILLPEYLVGSEVENTTFLVNDTYVDGDATPEPSDTDESADSIDVHVGGADYIVFRSGTYFQDGASHNFHVSVRGHTAVDFVKGDVHVWLLGYDTDADSLQFHGDDLLFVEPVAPSRVIYGQGLSADTFEFDAMVGGYGFSVKSIVAVITCTYREENVGSTGQKYLYEYEFGVTSLEDASAQVEDWAGDVFLLEDFVLPPEDTLRIAAGTRVHVRSEDLGASGADSSRVELGIEGRIEVAGTAAEPVVIRSWTPTASDDWSGIFIAEGGSGDFVHCTIADAEIGIDSYGPVTLSASTIENTAVFAVRAESTTVDVSNSTIRSSGGSGIFLDHSTATIDSSMIRECSDAGIWSTGYAALTITATKLRQDSIGIYVDGNWATGGQIGFHTSVDSNTVGIWYHASTQPRIRSCSITHNTTGVFLDAGSHAEIDSCLTSQSYQGSISSNQAGIYCADHSSPAISVNTFTNNGTGVGASDDSAPDLQMTGKNAFKFSTYYHVANLSTSVTIAATGNYWFRNTGSPDYGPLSSKILGPVNAVPGLGSAPNPAPGAEQPEKLALPTRFAVESARPNPFNPTVTIRIALPKATRVVAQVFDVTGKRVAQIADAPYTAGWHDMVWNGTSTRGQSLASGVYFLRVQAGRESSTRKIVLLK